MAKVKFVKEATVNGVKYSAGDCLNVSTSIYNRLVNGKLAQDYTIEKGTKKITKGAKAKAKKEAEK